MKLWMFAEVLERLQNAAEETLCVCVFGALTSQVSHVGVHPGVHVQPSHYQKNLQLNSWWIAQIQVYQCARACVRVCVFVCLQDLANIKGFNHWRSLIFCFYRHHILTFMILVIKKIYLILLLKMDRLSSASGCRPVQLPCQRLQTCLSISDYKPSNSSLCLNDRPFICASALSSYMTLMALTSCKLQQLAVWERECAWVRERVDERGVVRTCMVV